MPNAIELRGLTRRYAAKTEVVALDTVDLDIAEGGVIGVLGENGAGKTTLTKILATLLFPSEGSARVFGHDVVRDARAVRRVTTAVFGGDRGLYPMLSGGENLRYFGVLNGVHGRALRTRMPEVLEDFGLMDAADRRVETYSKGMRQRLHLCIGLLTRPRLLLLDEPTVGLDPNESARLREVIAGFPRQGTTVVLTSHNLLDIETLADRVVMLAHGRIAHDAGVDDFRRLGGVEAVVTVTTDGSAVLTDELKALGAASTPDGSRLNVPVARWSGEMLARLSHALAGQRIERLDVRTSTLDEAFAVASRTETDAP